MIDEDTKKLIEDIDKTAAELLAKVRRDDNIEQKELIVEQVKAFSEVVKWASIRKDLVPQPTPEKEPSKFDELRGKFHEPSSPPQRRGGRPRIKAGPEFGQSVVGEAESPDGNVADTGDPGNVIDFPGSSLTDLDDIEPA